MCLPCVCVCVRTCVRACVALDVWSSLRMVASDLLKCRSKMGTTRAQLRIYVSCASGKAFFCAQSNAEKGFWLCEVHLWCEHLAVMGGQPIWMSHTFGHTSEEGPPYAQKDSKRPCGPYTGRWLGCHTPLVTLWGGTPRPQCKKSQKCTIRVVPMRKQDTKGGGPRTAVALALLLVSFGMFSHWTKIVCPCENDYEGQICQVLLRIFSCDCRCKRTDPPPGIGRPRKKGGAQCLRTRPPPSGGLLSPRIESPLGVVPS